MSTQAEVSGRIKEIVADLLDIGPDEIPDHGVIGGITDNGEAALLDSLDGLKLGLTIEEEFRVPPPSPDDLPDTVTIADVVTYVIDHVQAANGGA